ncbi:RNA-directed DNA polymerase from mobile element jockey-like [Rhizophagus clarus]|uniref:RNA-directed DNA polymerase from mobile element jockey-like n=1 Tax=Rhizophagus clarus TaxID=94130 RepID=A0A8H3LDX3_9GLOM|nr:RNA-directed DNA polymerase from mobile element jockey-like [Rhizophagus clarus]
MESAHKHIKNKQISVTKRNNQYTIRNSSLAHDAKTIKTLILNVNKRRLQISHKVHLVEKTISQRSSHKHKNKKNLSLLDTLLNIIKRHELSVSKNYLTNFNSHNKSFQSILNKISLELDCIIAEKHADYTCEQIQFFIQERCLNYTDNKKAMIRSITDKDVKHISIHNVSGAVNKDKTITDPFWSEIYEPKSSITEDIYDNLLTLPTLEELLQYIRFLPNQKASGPSGISNEMIKHFGQTATTILLSFFLICIKLADIPRQWKKAVIYPIAKPKPYFSDLTNSRPITLLECLRKLFIKILNHRLSNIIKNHNNAKENDNDLWLLSQDLGKAYDRVNVFMLAKALRRIKLPEKFIDIITNLFINHSNEVITAYSNTKPYDILIGIDQGEVISPLLWTIYYDPLISTIANSGLGYNISSNTLPDIRQAPSRTTVNIPVTAFMDDT